MPPILLASILAMLAPWACAATTIALAGKHADGTKLGWVDWRGGTESGAVIGEHVCSGFIDAANCGWIHLGNGTPANGIRCRSRRLSQNRPP